MESKNEEVGQIECPTCGEYLTLLCDHDCESTASGRPLLVVYNGQLARLENGRDLALFLWGKDLAKVSVFVLHEMPRFNDVSKIGAYFDDVIERTIAW